MTGLVIRPLDESDAAAVAELYNKHPDVPHSVDRLLDAQMVLTELSERGTRLFLVAEQDGEILGTVGFFQSNTRRAYAPGHVLGDLFYLTPRIRRGTAAGSMLLQAVRTLRESGVDVIKPTVNPSNKLAFPMYRKMGCALTGPAEAGEDGNLELINVMPELINRLYHDFPQLLPSPDRLSRTWRLRDYPPAGSRPGSRGDIELIGGREVLRIEIALEQTEFRAFADPDTGELLHVSVGTGALTALPPGPAPASSETTSIHRGPLRLCLRLGDGQISLFHDDHLGPLLSEQWPVFGPPFVTGFRRALPRELDVTALADGWRVTEQHPAGVLVRRTTLTDRVLTQRVWWEGGTPPADRLRSLISGGLRQAMLVTADGYLPAGRGLYPIDTTGFAAAGLELPSTGRMGWWDPVGLTGLQLSWSGRTVRMVSHSWLLLDLGRADFEPGSEYRVELLRAMPSSVAMRSPGIVPLDPPAVRPLDRPASAAAGGWEACQVARLPVIRRSAGKQTLLLSADLGGVADWSSAGQRVLASPFPKIRSFASNPRWRAGLWVTRQGVREHRDTGMGWGEDTACWELSEQNPELRTAGIRWRIEPTSPDGAEVRVVAQPRQQDGEVVVWLTPAGSGKTSILIPGLPGDIWLIDKPGAWQCWSSRLAVRLAGLGWLAVGQSSCPHTEILCRSTPSGPLLGLVCRQPQGTVIEARWSLRVTSDPAFADQLIRAEFQGASQ